MNEQEHLKRVLAELRGKERIARKEANEQQIKANALSEAAEVVEVELTRFPKTSSA